MIEVVLCHRSLPSLLETHDTVDKSLHKQQTIISELPMQMGRMGSSSLAITLELSQLNVT